MSQIHPEGQPATGEQFTLSRGDSHAVVAALAGGLRSFTVEGVQLVETYPDDSIAPSAAGILLAPWPNRVADARWTLGGEVQQLDITEPSRGHASHGLLRNTAYGLVRQTPECVILQAAIHPQHGWPFHLLHRVSYCLDGAGLRVRQELVNLSGRSAPAAFGAHPFLRLGDTPTEDLELTVQASARLETDDRLIPTGEVPVDGGHDLRRGRRVGEMLTDTAYTRLTAEQGEYRHVLRAPDGRSLTLWTDQAFPYVHVFVTDRFPGRARAVAIEPMTAPANALNSGEGLLWLDPGASVGGEWGIRPGRSTRFP